MAGNSIIDVGQSVPIVLQINDGNTGLYPQAEIRDHNNILLNTLNLVHIASGCYKIYYIMPAVDFIVSTYIVYSDSNHTTEDTNYYRDVDIFVNVNYKNDLSNIQTNLNNPNQYKADISGLSPANEYDTELAIIQSEVDGLDGESMRGTDLVPTNPLLIDDIRLNTLDANISSRSNHSTTDVDTELTSTHGAGSWGTSDLSNLESDVSDIKDMNYNKTVLMRIDSNTYTETVYEDDGITIKHEFNFIKSGATETRNPV